MKKVLLVAAVAGLSLVSCKKDYKCVCTEESGGFKVETTFSAKSGKKAAEAWCAAAPNAETKVNGTVASNSSKPTCKIQ